MKDILSQSGEREGFSTEVAVFRRDVEEVCFFFLPADLQLTAWFPGSSCLSGPSGSWS